MIKFVIEKSNALNIKTNTLKCTQKNQMHSKWKTNALKCTQKKSNALKMNQMHSNWKTNALKAIAVFVENWSILKNFVSILINFEYKFDQYWFSIYQYWFYNFSILINIEGWKSKFTRNGPLRHVIAPTYICHIILKTFERYHWHY